MNDIFSRSALLLGEDAILKLSRSHVAVFGVGGVGGGAVEALARGGIGTLTLVDNDVVSLSNINRQTIATQKTVGRLKTAAWEERIHDVNPDCRVIRKDIFFLPETADAFDFSEYDYILDCVDTITAKVCLVKCANEAHVPIISAMGAGNKLDPTQFEVCDIQKTSVCPLARAMRTALRKEGIEHLDVVYSKEPPLRPRKPGSLPGSVSFVPPVMGYIMAGEAIRKRIE